MGGQISGQKIWLTLTKTEGGEVLVEVPLHEALALDRKGFAALYREHVLGPKPKRKEALAWADEQIAQRADYLSQTKGDGRWGA
jgi:hypothetical protein